VRLTACRDSASSRAEGSRSSPPASARAVDHPAREVQRRQLLGGPAGEESRLHPPDERGELVALAVRQIAAAPAAPSHELHKPATLSCVQTQIVISDQQGDLAGNEQPQHRHPPQPGNPAHATSHRSANGPTKHQPSVGAPSRHQSDQPACGISVRLLPEMSKAGTRRPSLPAYERDPSPRSACSAEMRNSASRATRCSAGTGSPVRVIRTPSGVISVED
jgi:hypothetical protein